uniref:Uncharacterized protein n=1 Tax=Anguilla anguilla TaxID=7936 RepID=A0A0E9SMK4_ANGAN
MEREEKRWREVLSCVSFPQSPIPGLTGQRPFLRGHVLPLLPTILSAQRLYMVSDISAWSWRFNGNK